MQCLRARYQSTVTPLDRGIVCSKRPVLESRWPDLLFRPHLDAEVVRSTSVYEGKLVRFAPDGTLDRTVGLPVENATSVIFGGPNLDIAYVTSMKRVVKGVRQREREAGGLFAVYGRARRPRHSGAALPGLMSSRANPIWNSPACRGASGIATRAILV